MAKPNDGTHQPRVKTIERLMKEHGLTRQKLADKAPVSPVTLRSVLCGNRAGMATLAKIARVLGVKPVEIIADEDADDAAPPVKDRKDRRKAAVSFARGFDSFDETEELPELIEAIKKQIGGKYKIYIIAIAPGSVVITLDMHVEDADRLEAAFKAGRLKPSGVTRVYLYPLEKEQPPEGDHLLSRTRYQPKKEESHGGLLSLTAPSWRLGFAVAACLLALLALYAILGRGKGGKNEVVKQKDKEPAPKRVPQLDAPLVRFAASLPQRAESLKIASGPYAGGFRLQENDGRLNWYFCNLGLLPLCKTQPAAIVAYLNLYLKNVDPDTGTIADVKDIATGARQPPDSDDSYAATFLTLASRYTQASGDAAWWQANRASLKQVARKALLAAQTPSGLVKNFAHDPARAACLLMDNCEVYQGLSEFSRRLAGDKDADASIFADAASKVARGIAGLYDPAQGAFRVADIPAASTFYPLRAAQAYPEVFGVPLGDEAQTRRMYDAAWQFMNATGERWETGEVTDGSLGGYPWMVLGYAAAKHGDYERAVTQNNYLAGQLRQPAPRPQCTAVHELGWSKMTLDLLAAAK